MAKQEWFDTEFYTVEKSNLGNIRVKPYSMYKTGRLEHKPYRNKTKSKRTNSVWIIESGWGRWVDINDIKIIGER